MIFLKNSVYFDIPKTGGEWVSEGLLRFASGRFEAGTSHRPPDKPMSNSFTFIRHPLGWYRSYFASFIDRNPQEMQPFSEFMGKVYSGEFDLFGRKWTTLTDYLQPFLTCSFIGKTENLANDLEKVLRMYEGGLDKGNMLNRDKINVSKYLVSVDPKTVKLIKRKEKDIIDQFYAKN